MSNCSDSCLVSVEIDPYRRRDIDWLVEGAFDTWGQQEPSTGDL